MLFLKIFLLLTLLNGATRIFTFTPNGYCNKIVADLVSAPIQTFFKNLHEPSNIIYSKLPFDDIYHGATCPRIGQLLIHDPVEILKYDGDQVYIKVPQWQYRANNKTNSNYWTLRSNISPLTLEAAPYIPHYYPYQIPNQAESTQDDQIIIVLHTPWYDKKTKTTYSAGTRFVALANKPVQQKRRHRKTSKKMYETKSTYIVHSLASKTATKIHIPKTHAALEKKNTDQNIRTTFLKILQSWSCDTTQKQPCTNYIPYVLGGSSFSHLYQNNADHKNTKFQAATGLDCSHLITRAAQLAGMPLYAANSAMLLKTLRPLKQSEPVENGDIIYFTGHVAVITDIQKNLLTEARSQSTNNGHGLIQTIPLNKQFQGISTVAQLVDAYCKKKKVVRLNHEGKKIQTIHNLTLLKLC